MAATKPAASTAKRTTRKPTTARKTTTRRKPAAKPVEPVEETIYTDQQKQAMLETYQTFSQAGLEVPAGIKTLVEGWIVEIQAAQAEAVEHHEQYEQSRVAKANIEGPWYVRNCYPAPFNFRLDRQTEKRRIELKPRGTPGDLHPLKDEDLRDPILIQNVNIGLLEVIPAGEAQLVIEKQTTNMGTRVHTPFAVIQKEYAEHHKRGMDVNPNPTLKVEAEYGAQGVTVAYTNPDILQGRVPDRAIAGKNSFGGLQRAVPGQEPRFAQPAPTIHSGFVPTGGNPAIISQGGPIGDNARAKAADDVARRRGAGTPAAGFSGPIQVTVAPTQRT